MTTKENHYNDGPSRTRDEALETIDRAEELVHKPPAMAIVPGRQPRPSIDKQIDALRDLEDGWLDGDGLAPTPVSLIWLHNVLHDLLSDLPAPYLYPTHEGFVEAEWYTPEWYAAVTFDFKSLTARCLVSNPPHEKIHEATFDMRNDGALDLMHFLERYAK